MQPDWKNPAVYAYAASLDEHGKAWEYLRRNAEYTKCWESYLQLIEKLESKYGPVKGWHRQHNNQALWVYDPPINPAEMYKDWLDRCFSNRLEPDCVSHRVGMGRKWGLTELHDPSQQATGKERFLPLVSPRIWYHGEEVGPPNLEVVWGQFAYIEIDLQRKVSPQIEKAVGRVLAKQAELGTHGKLIVATSPKPHDENFVWHLRILDAYAANASQKPKMTRKEIASVLFPEMPYEYPSYKGGKLVDEYRMQAERYRNGGYRALI
jgi:hypothetical protein